MNSKAFERQIQVFEDRAGKGAADPIIRDGQFRAGDRLLAYYRRRFYRAKSTRGWPPLAPSTRKQKQRDGTYKKGTLRRTDALFNSLRAGGANNVRRVVNGIVQVGSNDPKLKFHQNGTSKMPARKVIVPPDNQTSAEMDRELSAAVDRLWAAILNQAA